MNASKLRSEYEARNNGHFFDRSSMKFFGDTMKNYYVSRALTTITPYSGEPVECYELTRVHPVKGGLNSSAYFDTETFQRVINPSSSS